MQPDKTSRQIRSEINALADNGGGFYPPIGDYSRSLDGSDVAVYLKAVGFDVVTNYDTGRNGLAVTSCGLHVSTNGYVSRGARA